MTEPSQHPNSGQRKPLILIAIAAYDWAVKVHTEISLLSILREVPAEFSVQYGMNDGVARTRNNLVADMLKNPSIEGILFIDSDIIATPRDVARLIASDKDIICGMYPKKQGKLCWVMGPLDPKSQPDPETKLWEMSEAGTGFMYIRRHVFEGIMAKYPERKYKGDPEPDSERFDFFPMHAKDCRYLSEDWYFCHMARGAGFRVWMDTSIQLKHVGQIIFPLANTLTNDEVIDLIHHKYEIPISDIEEFLASKATREKPKNITVRKAASSDEAPQMQDDLRGWNSNHPIFNRLISEVKPKTIVELGSWKGASAVNMARMSDARIYCVDTWLGGVDHLLNDHLEQNQFKRVDGWPQLYHQFMHNIRRAGVAERIAPIPQSTANGLRLLAARGVSADLIYVDASHEYEDVYLDLCLAWPLIKSGGVLFGDDFQMEGVGPAVVRFAAEHRLHIEIDQPFWVIKK